MKVSLLCCHGCCSADALRAARTASQLRQQLEGQGPGQAAVDDADSAFLGAGGWLLLYFWLVGSFLCLFFSVCWVTNY